MRSIIFTSLVLASSVANALVAGNGEPTIYKQVTVGNVVSFLPSPMSPSIPNRYEISSASDGTPIIRSSASMSVPGGGTIPVNVKSKVDPVRLGKAVGGLATKLIVPLQIGMALKEILDAVGVTSVYDPVSGKNSYSEVPQDCGFPVCTGPSPGNGVIPSDPRLEVRGIVCLGPETSAFKVWNTQSNELAGSWCPTPRGSTRVIYGDRIADLVAGKTWPQDSKLPEVLRDAVDAGEDVVITPTAVTGPAVSPGAVTTTTVPGGNATTSNTTNTYNYEGNKVTVTTNTTNVTTTPSGQVVTSTTAVTSTQQTTSTLAAEKVVTCGLPDSPKCKIDETGTPVAEPKKEIEAVDDLFKPLKELAQNPTAKLPTLPTISWSFQLPAGCTAISIPAFHPFLQSLDICPFQAMFHNIMSMVWIFGGLFGAISLFWRNVFAQT